MPLTINTTVFSVVIFDKSKSLVDSKLLIPSVDINLLILSINVDIIPPLVSFGEVNVPDKL